MFFSPIRHKSPQRQACEFLCFSGGGSRFAPAHRRFFFFFFFFFCRLEQSRVNMFSFFPSSASPPQLQSPRQRDPNCVLPCVTTKMPSASTCTNTTQAKTHTGYKHLSRIDPFIGLERRRRRTKWTRETLYTKSNGISLNFCFSVKDVMCRFIATQNSDVNCFFFRFFFLLVFSFRLFLFEGISFFCCWRPPESTNPNMEMH